MDARRKRGRPKWYPTPEQILKIEQMAAMGCTKEIIAQQLNISYPTFQARQNDFRPFLEAITRGRNNATVAMASVPYKIGLTAGHKMQFHAAKFWLERIARGPWQQTTVVATEPGQPVEVRGRVDAKDIIAGLAKLAAARKAIKK